jgi:putative FmdB family regulatory protein
MPIFEFRCQGCGAEFEKLVFGNDEVECPNCQQKQVEKLMSACSAKVGYKFTAASNPKGASCTGCAATSCSTCH